MKQNNRMEMVGILSLSTLVTSAMSVSCCLPDMLNEYSGYSRAAVENLMTIPAFAMMIVIALTPMLLKVLNERIMVCIGLLLMGLSGIVPAFFTAYPLVLASRILLGVGIGMINTKAVSMIGERYSGDLRQRLQGIRCSMETLGQAILTFIAGRLLTLGWNYSFFIFVAPFAGLLLYLVFVPAVKPDTACESLSENKSANKANISARDWLRILKHALLGGLVVTTLSCNSLRMASYVIERGIGTATDGATILSVSIFAGFLGGLTFGTLIGKLKSALLPVSMTFVSAGLAIIMVSGSFMTIAFGASICGFFTTMIMSCVFNGLSDHLPAETLDTANSAVLVGCNLGSSIAPLVLQLIGVVNPELSAGFMTFAVIFLILSIGSSLKAAVSS